MAAEPRGRRAARRARRRRARIRILTGLAVSGAALTGGVAVVSALDGSSRQDEDRVSASPSARATTEKPVPTSEERPDPGPTPGPATAFPESGPGTFTAAPADGRTYGTGTVQRYRVEIEDGTGLSVRGAAAEIGAVLGDARGWTRDGTHAFRPVDTGRADFVIRIATPATVDRLCGAYGLHTRGEVNCRAGTAVVVNLKRWLQGSPQFDGPVTDYRALIVNHEVGHWLGHGHETCPGPGRPAPAMMQQIKGLKGCVSNAWPYDADGRYLGGPAVP
ncbi:DUF3152 domain-containing protein [Streptomyces sannanensis]|uniref:DUF3152 domain-containing protein n=1 Tax=Streptomyces sannanensis TaxID=285536 RepID=A0ABP6SDS3_9ACTN